MENPTKQQMQYVIDKFKTILPLAKTDKQFDMDERRVSVVGGVCRHECGTVHCVGGWYAVANKDHKSIKNKMRLGVCYFYVGIELIAHDLGFSKTQELGDWAKDNPKKWGNTQGQLLDCCKTAYDNANNMREVVSFLEKVKERL